MAKYYVQCGLLQLVTTAEDARGAALWGLHSYLAERLPLDAIDWTDPSFGERADWVEAVLSLGSHVVVSESGFRGDPCLRLDATELLVEWSQFAVAVTRLERVMAASGDGVPEAALSLV